MVRSLTRFNYWLYLSVFNCEKNLEDNLERIILMNVSKNHSNDLISAHLAVEDNNIVVPDMSLDSITNLQLDITRFWMIPKVNSFTRASRTARLIMNLSFKRSESVEPKPFTRVSNDIFRTRILIGTTVNLQTVFFKFKSDI